MRLHRKPFATACALLAVPLLCANLSAQDATLLMQQQVEQQQITQQQITQEQLALANQQTLDAAQSAAALNNFPLALRSPAVELTPDPGTGSVRVVLKPRSRNTAIFYTLDGWTPTPASQRYLGPFVLEHPAMLQFAAYGPGARSITERRMVDAHGAAPAPSPAAAAEIDPGTTVELAFSQEVQSRGHAIGDALPVVLGEDLQEHGHVVAPKGTPVLTTILVSDKAGFSFHSGSLQFAARSVRLTDGRTLGLVGGERLDGKRVSSGEEIPLTLGAAVIPLLPVFFKGHYAIIRAGATFSAKITDAHMANPASSPSGTE